MRAVLRFLCMVSIAAGMLGSVSRAQEKMIGLRFPALSPDGKKVAFSYLGDIWVASVEGGKATRITDHPAYDREPVWSPDGRWIAFSSSRDGNLDVFIVASEGGSPRQLTYHTGSDVACDFSPDGRWVLFRSSRSSSSSLFKVPVTGGNPRPVLDTYWSWPYWAKYAPDGKSVLFSLGMENRFWWRRGYRGSNSAKLWRYWPARDRAEKVFGDSANAFWPCWGPDGRIYFVSDRELGCKNIWRVTDGGAEPVTTFREGDVMWLSVARNAPLAVYERNFEIWITNLESGESHAIHILAPAERKSDRFFWVKNPRVSEFQLSPDGKKIALVARGEIFVMSSEGGYARNITRTPWRERELCWDKNSRYLVYVSDVDANPDLYITSALGDEPPRRLTYSPEDERLPKFSPDGKWIAYYRGKRQIRLMKADGSGDRLLLEADFGGRFADPFSWSPDSRYLAVVLRRNGNEDIVAVNVETGELTDLTNTAYDETFPVWSPDGKFLLFRSNRFGHSFPEFTGKWDLYRVFLQPKPPEFEEDKFEKLFDRTSEKKKEKKEKKKKRTVRVELRLEDLDLQTERITNTLGNDGEFVLSPKDTATVYFVSNIDGKLHLWKTRLKEKERGRYEPFMPGILNPQNLQTDAKGKYLYYLSGGRIGRIALASKKQKSIPFGESIRVDKVADYEQMLAELYYTLQHYFYDETHHNIDWKGVYERFRPVLQQVREDLDFYDYANQMIGYLNSSHTGIRPPAGERPPFSSNHVGAVWDFQDGAVVLKRMIKNGPLYAHRDSLQEGAQLVRINGELVKPEENLWKRLNGKPNRRLKLTFLNPGGDVITVAVKPISAGRENRLLLEEWIESRREFVRQKTDDQVAYIYMRAMGRSDLERFLKELERDAVPRKGLILDLRYNFGGNVHDRVLQALTKPVYAKWKIRGLSETPQSTFGMAHKPVVLLINEVTLSDGEMTANGFKTLRRGPVVGNTTYGWLIFTTSVRLMNGGSFRLPFWGCYTLDGKDLETSGGVKPDMFVINDLNDDLRGQDPQLEKAIEVILKEIRR